MPWSVFLKNSRQYVMIINLCSSHSLTSLNCFTYLIFNLHTKYIHYILYCGQGRIAFAALYLLNSGDGYFRHISKVLLGYTQSLTLRFHYILNIHKYNILYLFAKINKIIE